MNSRQVHPRSEPTFEELIAPIEPETFFETYWDKAPLHLSRKDPSYYESLFPLADLDRCIYSARQCAQDNLTIIPPPDSGRKMQRYAPGALTMEKAYNAIREGDTIRLMAIQASWPPMAMLAASISEAMSAKVNINFYMTPANSQGFPIHVDTHDVFIVQVEGAKDWYVYKPLYELPVYTLGHNLEEMKGRVKSPLEPEDVELMWKVRLETGDLLFLPRGYPHKAATTGEPSLHLTVGVHPLYWIDLAKAAVERLSLEHQELRCSLPPGFARDPEIRREMPGRIREILAGALEDLSFEELVDKLVETRVTASAFPPDGHFAQLLRLDQVQSSTVVGRRRGIECLVRRKDDSVGVIFASNEMFGPARIGPALEFVAANRRFRVDELPGLDEKSKIVLTRRLIREGLLRVVGDEAAEESSSAPAFVSDPASVSSPASLSAPTAVEAV